MKHFLETHFSLILLFSCVAGLIVPGVDRLPSYTVVILLAGLTFVSAFRMSREALQTINWRQTGLYYVARYLVLPVIFYYLALPFDATLALGIFLLALLPAGMSCPAFTNLFGGNVTLAFALTIPSVLLCVLVIPAQFALFTDSAIAPSPGHLFQTLMLCVVLPLLLHLPVRRRAMGFMLANDKWLSVVTVAVTVMVVVANQRAFIFAHPQALLWPLVLAVGCYVLFALFGWMFAAKQERAQRITYAVCSGFNNVALGVSLAFLHFPAPVVLFFVMCEAGWALLPLILRGAERLRRIPS